MSQHKFFSGLPPKMENRAGHGPNRQQTQFYWPEDANKQLTNRNRRMSRSSSKDSGSNWDASHYDTDKANKAIRERKSKQLQSRIEFYDLVDEVKEKKSLDINQNNIEKIEKSPDSIKNEKHDVKNEDKIQKKTEVNGNSHSNEEKKANETQNSHKSIEKLEERIHDIQLEEPTRIPPENKRPDYDSYDSDEEYQRRRMKKTPSRTSKRQDSWEEYENREIRRPPLSRRPPRSNYEYDDEYYPSYRGASRERYRREYIDEYDSRPIITRPPPSPRRYVEDYPEDRYYEGPPTPRRFMMDPDYEPIDRDFYYEEPSKDTLPPTPPRNQKTLQNGTASPVKRNPVKRAMSVCSDCPSEISRAMSHRHLKSNIFFTDKEALASTPRPRTVRDSAVNRVCVGLPDIE